MGNSDENGNYTDENVIYAVKKITGKDVVAEAETVKSQKENEVDISDLWRRIHFTFKGSAFSCP